MLNPARNTLQDTRKKIGKLLLLISVTGLTARYVFAQQSEFPSAETGQDLIAADVKFANSCVGASLGQYAKRDASGFINNRERFVKTVGPESTGFPHCICRTTCDVLPNAFHNQQRSEGQSTAPRKKEQSKRLLWIVPNFAAVSSDTQLPALTAKGKFQLAFDDGFDYSSFVWTGVVAAQSYALNSDPELGQGATGYSRYYWRALLDGVSGTFFTEAIVPSITHEDPRYYTLGNGGLFRRTAYALSRTVVTKTDSGGRSFNWSEAGGNFLEASLSNAYYPPQERGLSQTARNWGTQMESAALNNIAKEFWPDIRHGILTILHVK